MKVKNTEVKVNDKEFNDKDILNNILSNIKCLAKNYAILLTEVSNSYEYDLLKNDYLQISDMQRQTFELAFQNGWYELTTASKTSIEEAKTNLENQIKNN